MILGVVTQSDYLSLLFMCWTQGAFLGVSLLLTNNDLYKENVWCGRRADVHAPRLLIYQMSALTCCLFVLLPEISRAMMAWF